MNYLNPVARMGYARSSLVTLRRSSAEAKIAAAKCVLCRHGRLRVKSGLSTKPVLVPFRNGGSASVQWAATRTSVHC